MYRSWSQHTPDPYQLRNPGVRTQCFGAGSGILRTLTQLRPRCPNAMYWSRSMGCQMACVIFALLYSVHAPVQLSCWWSFGGDNTCLRSIKISKIQVWEWRLRTYASCTVHPVFLSSLGRTSQILLYCDKVEWMYYLSGRVTLVTVNKNCVSPLTA